MCIKAVESVIPLQCLVPKPGKEVLR